MYVNRYMTTIKLLPLHCPERAVELPINLAPNSSFVRGTVLGQTTTAANEVQTVATTGTPTGGTIGMALIHPITGQTLSFTLAFDSSAAAAQTAIRAQTGANVTVTGGPLPTGLVFTFNTDFASLPITPMVATSALTGGTSPAVTVTRTTTGVTANTYGTYADAGSGGLDTARCILAYDCVTDGAGYVTLGTVAAGAGERGAVSRDTPAYFVGIFKTTELTGLTAAAVADLGRLFSGTAADGVLSMS